MGVEDYEHLQQQQKKQPNRECNCKRVVDLVKMDYLRAILWITVSSILVTVRSGNAVTDATKRTDPLGEYSERVLGDLGFLTEMHFDIERYYLVA